MTGGFFLSKLDISKNTLTQIPALYELVSGWLILTSVLTGLYITSLQKERRNDRCALKLKKRQITWINNTELQKSRTATIILSNRLFL